MEDQQRDELLQQAQAAGGIKKYLLFAKLSGPGWLQGAITLGGGSLAGALYLGVVAGFGLMWLQPLAMICGIIMLSAIAYVTLTTGKRPFGLINRHLSPVLGWAWLLATVLANIVWCMPQYNLARAAIQQNLLPAVGDSDLCTAIICAILFAIALYINHLYQSEGRGPRAFDWLIKGMVGLIVLSFFAVVVTLTVSGGIQWGTIFQGLVPDPSLLFRPAEGYTEFIAKSSAAEWWTQKIIDDQRDIIIAAFGTAVGINMTWLLPYSLLKKRWGRSHRELSIFDLSIGLLIPFFLATSCVVIASASQFHVQTADVPPEAAVPTIEKLETFTGGQANDADQELARMLVKRDNFQLAESLTPLAGSFVSQKIFGLGVLGMAISTIIILMLMNGMAFQELFNRPDHKPTHMIGCVVAGLAGSAGPFIWTGAAAAALAIPTSVIGGSLIPIAYLTFFLMMNSKAIMGSDIPGGKGRVLWNTLMLFATSVATFGSIWVLSNKAGLTSLSDLVNDWQLILADWHKLIPAVGLILLLVLFIVGILSFFRKHNTAATESPE